jgi:hypothetical protein
VTYQLTNAIQGAPESAATAGSAAPAADQAHATAPQTYRLIANPSALTPHVGKKLALTGTLENQDSASASSASGAEPKMAAFRVESGKVLAESCDQK